MYTCLRCLNRSSQSLVWYASQPRPASTVAGTWHHNTQQPARKPSERRRNVLPSSDDLQWTGSTEAETEILARLRRAMQTRSQNGIIEQLEVLKRNNLQNLLKTEHLSSIIRCLRPYNYFSRPTATDVHELYRRRMTYFRNWLANSNTILSADIYLLLLEEGRLDSAHYPWSQITQRTWDAMRAAGIKPDTFCYNSYLATVCVQPRTFDRLRRRKVDEGEAAKLARKSRLEHATKLARKAVLTYNEMLQASIQSNAMTIELLMLALAYAGNLSGLRSLVLQTWNVRIPAPAFEALEDQGVPDEYEEEGIDFDEVEQPGANVAKISVESGMFPTQKSLSAIALSLGSNQQNRMALVTVQLFARVYSLKISTPVWTELMKWAHIDSKRCGGFTDVNLVQEIMDTAREQYGIRPSISMYNLLIKNYILRQENPRKTLQLLEELVLSVEGNAEASQPVNKKNSRVPHAKAVAEMGISRVERSLATEITQLERKLVDARASGGSDQIRLVEDDLARRIKNLRELSIAWADRMQRLDDTVSAQVERQRTAARQHPAHHQSEGMEAPPSVVV